MDRASFVLFDIDGTLVDPYEGITNSFKHALGSLGIKIPDESELRTFIGPPLRDTFKESFGMDTEQAEAATAKYREHFAKTGVFQRKPYPGARKMLESVRESGAAIAIASSKAMPYALATTEEFADLISFVSAAELDGTRSQKRDIIRHAMESVPGMTSSNTIMVGDRKHDALGAKANGMAMIGVLYGYGGRAELEAAGADYLCESPEDVARLIHDLARR